MKQKIAYILLFVSIFLLACESSANKIEINVDTLFTNDRAELPSGGIKITIDTLSKVINIPLQKIVWDNTTLPCFDSQNKDLKYNILSWNQNERGNIIFDVSCKEDTFRCVLSRDSLFIVVSRNANEIVFSSEKT